MRNTTTKFIIGGNGLNQTNSQLYALLIVLVYRRLQSF